MHRRHAVLVDCLTLWLSNIMLAGRERHERTSRPDRRACNARRRPVSGHQ